MIRFFFTAYIEVVVCKSHQKTQQQIQTAFFPAVFFRSKTALLTQSCFPVHQHLDFFATCFQECLDALESSYLKSAIFPYTHRNERKKKNVSGGRGGKKNPCSHSSGKLMPLAKKIQTNRP
uniref:Uncharacterized protein n=1 Tax=Strigops habroptila TaxID=2489341 RepID=A0A672U149_STRHB